MYLWVISLTKCYGLWGTSDVWVIPAIPTWEGPNSMGYQGLQGSMGYGEFDCIRPPEL